MSSRSVATKRTASSRTNKNGFVTKEAAAAAAKAKEAETKVKEAAKPIVFPHPPQLVRMAESIKANTTAALAPSELLESLDSYWSFLTGRHVLDDIKKEAKLLDEKVAAAKEAGSTADSELVAIRKDFAALTQDFGRIWRDSQSGDAKDAKEGEDDADTDDRKVDYLPLKPKYLALKQRIADNLAALKAATDVVYTVRNSARTLSRADTDLRGATGSQLMMLRICYLTPYREGMRLAAQAEKPGTTGWDA